MRGRVLLKAEPLACAADNCLFLALMLHAEAMDLPAAHLCRGVTEKEPGQCLREWTRTCVLDQIEYFKGLPDSIDKTDNLNQAELWLAELERQGQEVAMDVIQVSMRSCQRVTSSPFCAYVCC